MTRHTRPIPASIIILAAAWFAAAGCEKIAQRPGTGPDLSGALAAGPDGSRSRPGRSALADRSSNDDQPDVTPAARGDEVDADPPVIEVGPELRPTSDDLSQFAAEADPGAALLVEAMRTAIGVDERAVKEVEIAFRSLRNQSRGTAEELRILRARLLAILGIAGEGRQIRFVDEPTEFTEYTLGGSVYLIDRGGEPFWELYLALRPQGANWRIWKNADPIRLEREKKMAGDDRIEYGGGG